MLHVDDFVIDRFEGDIAVCVDDSRNVRELLRPELPPGAKEGDHILRFPGGPWRLDDEKTREKRNALKQRMDQLWDD